MRVDKKQAEVFERFLKELDRAIGQDCEVQKPRSGGGGSGGSVGGGDDNDAATVTMAGGREYHVSQSWSSLLVESLRVLRAVMSSADEFATHARALSHPQSSGACEQVERILGDVKAECEGLTGDVTAQHTVDVLDKPRDAAQEPGAGLPSLRRAAGPAR